MLQLWMVLDGFLMQWMAMSIYLQKYILTYEYLCHFKWKMLQAFAICHSTVICLLVIPHHHSNLPVIPWTRTKTGFPPCHIPSLTLRRVLLASVHKLEYSIHDHYQSQRRISVFDHWNEDLGWTLDLAIHVLGRTQAFNFCFFSLEERYEGSSIFSSAHEAFALLVVQKRVWHDKLSVPNLPTRRGATLLLLLLLVKAKHCLPSLSTTHVANSETTAKVTLVFVQSVWISLAQLQLSNPAWK